MPGVFFFSSRRRHTRLQGDWSSDVCSSDLPRRQRDRGEPPGGQGCHPRGHGLPHDQPPEGRGGAWHRGEIGRASCRERVEMSESAVAVEKKEDRLKTTKGSTAMSEAQETKM